MRKLLIPTRALTCGKCLIVNAHNFGALALLSLSVYALTQTWTTSASNSGRKLSFGSFIPSIKNSSPSSLPPLDAHLPLISYINPTEQTTLQTHFNNRTPGPIVLIASYTDEDGVLHSVAHFSKKLPGAEQNYDI